MSPCARVGCGQEECATIHMTSDEFGGHDYLHPPTRLEYTVYVNGPDTRVTFSRDNGHRTVLDMPLTQAKLFAADMTRAVGRPPVWRRRAFGPAPWWRRLLSGRRPDPGRD